MENNTIYQRIRDKHPDWTEDQVWTAVSLDMQADAVIDEKGKDVSVDDPDIMESVIQGAMDWLDEVLPLVFEKVKELFAGLLQNIGKWISKGWNYLMEFISNNL